MARSGHTINEMPRSAILLACTALVLSACSSSDPIDETTTSISVTTTSTVPDGTTVATETTSTTAPLDGRQIVMVVDELRAVALAETAQRFTTDTGIEVLFDIQPRAEILDRSREGDVDIFMGPHTWAPGLLEANAVQTIPTSARDWTRRAFEAFASPEGLIAVPFSAESLVLYWNTELLEDEPTDLLDGCGDVVESCIVMPGVGQAGGYHLSQFLMANSSAQLVEVQTLPDQTPGLLSLERLLDEQILILTSTTAARQTFASGAAAMLIGGPWDLGPLEDSGVPFAIVELPKAGDAKLTPPVSVQGMYLSSTAPLPDEATTFLVDYLASAETQTALHIHDRRAPVYLHLLAEISTWSDSFLASTESGFLIPFENVDVYWDEFGVALEEIAEGGDPEAAVGDALTRILERNAG